jgi:branched-chain amino acid transport system substrate-binding protein
MTHRFSYPRVDPCKIEQDNLPIIKNKNMHILSFTKKFFIEIEKISLHGLDNSQLVVEQGNTMAYNHTVFEDIHNLCVSGWKDPYLRV